MHDVYKYNCRSNGYINLFCFRAMMEIFGAFDKIKCI